MNPKVSIIVPCYNTASYLNCCVNSLVNQTIKEIEIILVDDESPDEIPEMCDEWAAKDARIKVIHKKNEGLGFARNTGLENAKGEYVIFVDSDDYIEPYSVEYLYNLCTKEGFDILRYADNRFSQEGVFNKETGINGNLTVIDNRQTIRDMAKWLFGENPKEEKKRIFFYGSACMEMIRRSIIQDNNIKFVSERDWISEDYIFTYQCFKHCKKFGYTPATLYHYRYNPASLSRTPRTDGIDRQFKMSCYIEKILCEDGYGQDAPIIAMHHFINELRSATKLYIRSSLSNKEKQLWFSKNMKHRYLKKIYKEFPWQKLPLKERIHFLCCYYRLYPLILLLTLFQKK